MMSTTTEQKPEAAEDWLNRQRLDAAMYPRLALRGAFTERIATALRWIGSGKTVVDVGCGDGSISERIRLEGNDVTGLDFAEALGAARRYPKVKTQAGEAHRLPFPDASFDVCFAGEIIEHYEDPDSLVKEWTRVLKPGGSLIVTTPDGREASLKHPTHRTWFNRRTLGKLFRDCGLRVRRARIIESQQTLVLEGVKP